MSVDSRYARREVFCGRMISKRRFQIALVIAAALAAGCETQNQPPTPSPVPNAEPRKIDEWIGRWNGREGTYLEISKSGDSYEIRIKDLDKLQTYRGAARSDAISFERNGKIARGQKALFGDPEEPRILPGLTGSLQLI